MKTSYSSIEIDVKSLVEGYELSGKGACSTGLLVAPEFVFEFSSSFLVLVNEWEFFKESILVIK